MRDNIFDQSARRVCHLSMLNEPKFIDIKSKHLQIFRGNLRKTSEIFAGKFGKCSETFARPSDNILKFFGIFEKWSEIFGKSSKTSLLVGLYNDQNNTRLLGDMKFIFSCSNRYLTRSLRSLVRYRFQHSKIYFISPRNHVLSSI